MSGQICNTLHERNLNNNWVSYVGYRYSLINLKRHPDSYLKHKTFNRNTVKVS